MSERLTPRELLKNIKQNGMKDAPIATILQTPLAQLMEQLIEEGDSAKDTLGWLFIHFWSDEPQQMSEADSALVDHQGQLHSREYFGTELTDEEYALAQHTYALANWARSMYFNEPFDLHLLMPDYEPPADLTDHQPTATLPSNKPNPYAAEFSYTNQALRQWVLHTPLRRLAALITYIVVNAEVDRASRWNQTIQDYYAEHCMMMAYDHGQVAEIEKFTSQAWDDMKVMTDHCNKARELGLTPEQQRVVDALWSWVPHDFDDNVVAAGREICQQAQQLMPDALTIRSEQGSRAYINKVRPEIVCIADKYDVYLDTDDGYSLSLGYLSYWLDEKYWDGRRPEDE